MSQNEQPSEKEPRETNPPKIPMPDDIVVIQESVQGTFGPGIEKISANPGVLTGGDEEPYDHCEEDEEPTV